MAARRRGRAGRAAGAAGPGGRRGRAAAAGAGRAVTAPQRQLSGRRSQPRSSGALPACSPLPHHRLLVYLFIYLFISSTSPLFGYCDPQRRRARGHPARPFVLNITKSLFARCRPVANFKAVSFPPSHAHASPLPTYVSGPDAKAPREKRPRTRTGSGREASAGAAGWCRAMRLDPRVREAPLGGSVTREWSNTSEGGRSAALQWQPRQFARGLAAPWGGKRGVLRRNNISPSSITSHEGVFGREEKIENFIQEFPAGDICSAASHLMNSSNQPSAFHLEFGFATEFLQKHAGRTTSTGALNLTWIHRIDWVGKDLRDHQVQPLVQLQSID
ncbi:uncharacterized protein LOC110358960 isoform X1 [Columba livia]|uniref:uncharacterized protein LOC110358960 isoform X1 n=1 Tax=Columba livia TaxID=8932 RepID=UPI0031BB57BC